MLTTSNLATFLQLREGFRKHAYDDKNPNRKLTAETEIEGTLTIGFGTTEYPDGRKVEWDDKVTKSEGMDYVQHYIDNTIEPALENLIHVRLAGCQYDALGSCIYQYGEGEVAGWNLINLINNPSSTWEEIALEWINGTVMWHGEPLFWARRISELFMFFDLDWMAGGNVPVLSDVLAAIKLMGFDGTMPKPAPIVHEDLFEPDVITDPTPETPLTTEDLNNMQAESLRTGKRMSFDPVIMPVGNKPLSINTKAAEQVPYGIDPEAGLQPKEESRRYQRAVKKEKGAEMKKMGEALALAGTTAASANVASAEVRTFFGGLGQVGYTLIAVAIGAGVLYWIVGKVREKHNERKEVEAEINAVQGMY